MSLKPKPKIIDSVTVEDFYNQGKDHLKLSLVAAEEGLKKPVKDKSINRPALALTGYYKSFASKRIQVFGAGEMAYLKDIKEDHQYRVLTEIARKNVPCMIVSRNLVPTKAMFQVAEENHIPLIRTSMTSRDFVNTATLLMEDMFAPRITLHGTLMDVRGIGVLIRGESGVGKSECALALIERGHSLVADDIVYIKLIGEKELVGKSSDLNRGYMECRGLGIVNIAELFGIRSVRLDKVINLVITFKEWKLGMNEDRTGLEEEYFETLSQKVPHIQLPIRPGRDMARLVEVAAMIQAMKRMGHNPAESFNKRLIEHMEQHNS